VPLSKFQALGFDDGNGVHRTIMPARCMTTQTLLNGTSE
jgi:hypothetical protein